MDQVWGSFWGLLQVKLQVFFFSHFSDGGAEIAEIIVFKFPLPGLMQSCALLIGTRVGNRRRTEDKRERREEKYGKPKQRVKRENRGQGVRPRVILGGVEICCQ